MAYSEDLAARVREAIGVRDGLTEKKMFGGLGFMLNGNMCCGVVSDDLMVRVGAESHDNALTLPYARPMDFTGRPMKGFVFVDHTGIQADAELKQWLERGVSFAQSLPKK